MADRDGPGGTDVLIVGAGPTGLMAAAPVAAQTKSDAPEVGQLPSSSLQDGQQTTPQGTFDASDPGQAARTGALQDAGSERGSGGQEVVVTGSRIARAAVTAQPAEVLGSEQIERLGYTNLGRALQESYRGGLRRRRADLRLGRDRGHRQRHPEKELQRR